MPCETTGQGALFAFEGDKRCIDCKKVKPLTEFYCRHDHNGRGGEGPKAYCKDCQRVRSRNEARIRYNEKPECRKREIEKKLRQKFAKYGITWEEYQAIVADHQGRCAICRKPERSLMNGKVKRLFLGHDHKAVGPKSARGLLCSSCNSVLGHAYDDPNILLAAIGYLHSHLMRAIPDGDPTNLSCVI